jgi:hypothetical protein
MLSKRKTPPPDSNIEISWAEMMEKKERREKEKLSKLGNVDGKEVKRVTQSEKPWRVASI